MFFRIWEELELYSSPLAWWIHIQINMKWAFLLRLHKTIIVLGPISTITQCKVAAQCREPTSRTPPEGQSTVQAGHPQPPLLTPTCWSAKLEIANRFSGILEKKNVWFHRMTAQPPLPVGHCMATILWKTVLLNLQMLVPLFSLNNWQRVKSLLYYFPSFVFLFP